MKEKLFKKINLDQDSSENSKWLEWRKSGIGGSEVAILMGALPFKWNDVLELWKVKTGLKEDTFEMNEAMQRGKDLEPEARNKYIETTGIEVKPVCFERLDYPFIRASLDGLSKDYKHLVEIKCQGLPKWRYAKSGKIPEYYYPQIQYQALCTGATSAHFWSYRPEEGGVLIDVPRNDLYIEELIRRCKLFWEAVESKTPILPRQLGIDMRKESDPYEAGNMEVKLVGVYKN